MPDRNTLDTFYAHTPSLEVQDKKPELLQRHLSCVAERAQQFALSIKPPQSKLIKIAWLAGMLHDLGKYRLEFQEYLFGNRAGSQETHHAFYGAAAACYGFKNLELLFAIAGHHSGLHNRIDFQQRFSDYQAKERYPKLLERLESDIGKISKSAENSPPKTDQEKLAFEVYVRILFSCLVDADRLETARYIQGNQPEPKELQPDVLLDILLNHIKKRFNNKNDLTPLRDRIFESATVKGEAGQGFFSMTVPTGGGKTLSSMAFALAHAKKHGLRRIIVVIPYTSIIEQNASVYQEIFGDDIIVEHHSSAPISENGDEGKEPSSLQLAIENWDAPIIITTQVQFIESLFSRSPNRCRKLHNIAGSVVIMDEVQTLPFHLLNPSFSFFQELVKSYRTSILLCSATQPGFIKNISLSEGLKPEQVWEIAPNPAELFNELQRVNYHLPDKSKKLSWAALSEELIKTEQVLVVVNTRKQAFGLWESLKARLRPQNLEGVFHLSSSMCAQHRLNIINTIKNRLKNKLSCRLISTQLIEAGVDLDFPIVYRAIGPLDSIVQAAGRCNREGKLIKGDVYVFIPEDGGLPPGPYTTATDQTSTLLYTAGFAEEMAQNPAIFESYFSSLYQNIPTDINQKDGDNIQENRRSWNFKKVSEAAKVIKEETVSVIVPYGKAQEIISRIRYKPFFSRGDWRSLQRYMVSTRRRDMNDLTRYNRIENLRSDVDIKVVREGFYHQDVGLLIEQRPLEEFIV